MLEWHKMSKNLAPFWPELFPDHLWLLEVMLEICLKKMLRYTTNQQEEATVTATLKKP